MILLLVEDEEYTRNGILKSIKWPELGIEKIYTAEDGLEGIEIARSCYPDIVLTDIRMPRINGLKMAEEIRQISPHCALVFISGYSDKDYLKSAIHLSAIDFVFKPLDLNELNITLTKAVEHVKQNSENNAIISTMKYQELASLVIQDKTNNNEIIQMWKQNNLPLGQDFIYYTLLIKQKYSLDNTLLLKRIIEQFGIHFLIGQTDTFYLLHLIIPKNQHSILEQLISKLMELLQKEKENAIAVGIPVNSPLEIKDSFISARSAFERRFYHPDCQLFIAEGPAPALDILYNPNQEFKRLLLKDPDKARQWIISQFDHIRYYDGTPIEIIRNWIFQITTELYSYDFSNVNKTLNSPTDKAILWNIIASLNSLDEAKDFLLGIIDNLLEYSNNTEPCPFAVLETKRYIHLNYSNPCLSLDDIAQHVNLSSNYLCSIFKKSTNQTINQYLTDYRIHQAKLLLKSTSMHIYEIAHSTGYLNSSYFTKTFRKITGITPQEYRERHLIL